MRQLPVPRRGRATELRRRVADTTTLGWRPADLDRGFLPFLRGEGIATYLSDPAFRAGLSRPPEDDPAAVMRWASIFPNPSLSWSDLPFVRERWDGPIALKGILSADDARMAADAGMDGVVVSNHGGRQVDGAIASLDALPGVVDAVGDRLDVLLDSGVRTGADAVKALALGAKAVLVGRPYLYGLALARRASSTRRCLLAEARLTLHHSGCHGDQLLPASSPLRRARPYGGLMSLAVDVVLRPIRTGNTFEETVERLLHATSSACSPRASGCRRSGTWPPGSASRATLRDAIRVLEQFGYIESRRGGRAARS